MINDHVLGRFQALNEHLVRPIYADYSFANIPNTIHYLLTGERLGPLLPPDCFGGSYPAPRTIVLFFVDSFGWQFWQDHQARFRTTRRVVEAGILTPISALFPSTTSASVSTMSLGVLPAQHALYEWNVYIEAYGEVIQSLPFTPLGRHPGDTCLSRGYDPRQMLRRHETIFERLAARGVASYLFSHWAYAHSAYNKIISAGAEVIPHSTLAEALVNIKMKLPTITQPALLSFYWSAIDSIAHDHGPATVYHGAEIASFWHVVDLLFSDLDGIDDTLFLFTADHGQVRGDARQTLYLNERYPTLAGCLPTSPTGRPIYPNGSPRDLFLHLRPECRAEALALLGRELRGLATVLTVDAALEQGLFGPPPYDEVFRGRLGDLLVLPHDGQFIFWHEPDLMENRFHGHHGGLSREEMVTVLGVVDAL